MPKCTYFKLTLIHYGRHGLIGHGSFGPLLVLMFPSFAT